MGRRIIRRDRGYSDDSFKQLAGTLAQAIHSKTERTYLLGFDPEFDGRDDGVVTEITVPGGQMKFISSPVAGDYWQAFLPVHGGQVQVVIRDLPKDFVPDRRNTFCGLTRIALKEAMRGQTLIITIKVDEDRELTHELKIFQQAPEDLPANRLAVNAHRGMVAVLELPQQNQEAKAA